MRKIHVHHVIIVVNLMLVILERVGLVIYRVTWNSNVGNLPIEWLIKKKKTISFDTKKEVEDSDGAKIGNLKVIKYDPETILKTFASMIIRDELRTF